MAPPKTVSHHKTYTDLLTSGSQCLIEKPDLQDLPEGQQGWGYQNFKGQLFQRAGAVIEKTHFMDDVMSLK